MGVFIALVLCVVFVGLVVMVSRGESKTRNARKVALAGQVAGAVDDASRIKALIELGDFLYSGDNATQADGKEAIRCYKEAAALGSGAACRKLSKIHFGDHYTYQGDVRPETGFEYALKAAELGLEPSMLDVSVCYKTGRGVLKNIGKSTYWLLRSAESGNVDSMANLGLAYISGFGVQENPLEGLAWLYVAEHKNNMASADLIKDAESRLNSALILSAQDRAKVLLDLIKSGHHTDPSAFASGAAGPRPGQPSGPKPKHPAKGSGSGAVISRAGHVVTAAHVVKGASFIELVTPTGTVPATILTCDEQNDLALLKVEQDFESYIPVGRSSEVRLGQTVATIGFPNIGIQGHSPKVTQGMISGENGIQNDIRMWQVSVPIQPGNSGGPLLDESGRMVGVVVASLSLRAVQITGAVPQNVNYAIKGAYLEPLLQFHKVPVAEGGAVAVVSFQDMVASAQKSSVLVLTY